VQLRVVDRTVYSPLDRDGTLKDPRRSETRLHKARPLERVGLKGIGYAVVSQRVHPLATHLEKALLISARLTTGGRGSVLSKAEIGVQLLM
jgi:hypothetical protein